MPLVDVSRIEGIATDAEEWNLVIDEEEDTPSSTPHRFRVWADDPDSAGVEIARIEYSGTTSTLESYATTRNIGSATQRWTTGYFTNLNVSGGIVTTPIADTHVVFSNSGVLSGNTKLTWGSDTLTLGTNAIYSQGAHGLTLAADDWAVGSGANKFIQYEDSASRLIIKASSLLRFTISLSGAVSGEPYLRTDTADNVVLDCGTKGGNALYLNFDSNRPIQTGTGLFSLKGYANVGTTTLATAQGDFAAGLTAGNQWWMDQDTGIFYGRTAAATTAWQISSVAGTATWLNQQKGDIDFRVDGDNTSNLLLIDAGLDAVLFGTATQTFNQKLGSSFTFTNTSGTVSGTNWISLHTPSSASTTTFYGHLFDAKITGSQTHTRLSGALFRGIHQGTDTLNSGFGLEMDFQATNTGNVTNATGMSAKMWTTAANTIANAYTFRALAPAVSGGGAMTVWVGFRCDDPGAGPGTSIGFWQPGTNAHNRFNGGTKFGADSAPNTSYAVDITGNLLASGYQNLGTTTLASAQGDFAAGSSTKSIFFDETSARFTHINNNANTALAGRPGEITLKNSNATTNAYTLIEHQSDNGAIAAGIQFFNSTPASNYGEIVLHARSGVGYRERLRLGELESVFNEQGADIDFRVEGDTNANLLLLDAALDSLQTTYTATRASSASATADLVHYQAGTVTITGSTNITTATGFNAFTIEAPTYSAGLALTISNAATVYIAGAPTGAGAGPATITNAYPLWVDSGISRFDGSIYPGTTNSHTLGAGSLAWSDVFTRNIQADSSQALTISRQDGTAWATLSNGTARTQIGMSTLWLDNIDLGFGGSFDSRIRWDTAQTNDGLVISTDTGSSGQSGVILIIDDINIGDNYAHDIASNPTLAIHSSTAAATATDEYLEFYHDTTQGVIRTGSDAELRISGTTLSRLTFANPDTGTKEFYIEGGAAGAVKFDGTIGNQTMNFGTSGIYSHYRFRLGGASSEFSLQDASGDVFKILATTSGSTFTEWTQPANTSGTPKGLLFTAGAHTSTLNDTEVLDIDIDLSRNYTMGVSGPGASLATQRSVVFQPPTISGSQADITITDAATVAITGAPSPGANVAITNPISLWVQGGPVRIDDSITATGTIQTTGADSLIKADNAWLGDYAGDSTQAAWGHGTVFGSVPAIRQESGNTTIVRDVITLTANDAAWGDDQTITMGGSSDVSIQWDTGQTNGGHAWLFRTSLDTGTTQDTGNIVFTSNAAGDLALPEETGHVTLFVTSGTTPGSNYIRMWHDGDGHIDAAGGGLNIGTTTAANAVGEYAIGNADAHFHVNGSSLVLTPQTAAGGSVTISGNLNVGSTTAATSGNQFAAGEANTYLRVDPANDTVLFESDNSGAVGPIIRTYHNSASPAVNDVIGRWLFDGEGTNSVLVSYARVDAVIDELGDGAGTAGDGHLEFLVAINETLTERFAIYQNECRAIAGLVVGSDSAITSGYSLDVQGEVLIQSNTTSQLQIQSDAAGSTGAELKLYQNSVSPATNDIIGSLIFNGQNSTPAEVTYSKINGVIASTSASSENGEIHFQCMSGGSFVDPLRLELDNVSLFTGAGSYGGGTGVMFVGDAGAAGGGNPVGGGLLYSVAGAGTWRGSSGTITTFGPAEPHCPRCNMDYVLEWSNKKYARKHLAVCWNCLVKSLEKAGITEEEYTFSR